MADSTTDPELGGSRECPRGHEAGPRTDDRTIPRRVFLAVGIGGFARRSRDRD